MQSGSVPFSTLAARTASISCGRQGFMIAEVMPAPITIGMKPALMPWRMRQAEGDVRQAAGGVDLQFLAQAAQQREDLLAGGAHGADRHDQRIDDDVMRGMPKSAARSTIFLATSKRTSGSSEMPVSSLEMATTGNIVFLDQRQDGLELLFLAGDRIDQRPALGDLAARPRWQRSPRSRWTAARRPVPGRASIVWTSSGGSVAFGIDRGDAGVDVEHRRTGGDLLERILAHRVEIALDHLGGQFLAAGRIDALADDAERLVEADHDFAGRWMQRQFEVMCPRI